MGHRDEELPFSRLELYNFKSYKEHVTIEWKHMLSAVFGNNGAGKSSIVDAIEYAFCFKKYKVSAKVLQTDICTRGNDDRDCSSTWVRVTLHKNGEEKVFQRSTFYTKFVHKYSINGLDVTEQEYKNNLLELNINSKANVFLIQQNTIESIVMTDMKSRSEFFEHFSNSISHKDEYTRLNNEIKNLEEELNACNKDLKFQKKQKRKLTEKSIELQKYDELRKEMDQTEMDYYFTKLYNIDITIDQLEEEDNNLRKKIKAAEKLRLSFENAVLDSKQNLDEFKRQLTTQLKSLKNSRAEVSKFSLELKKCQKQLSMYEKEIVQVNENLNNIKKKQNASKNNIDNLHQQYEEVQKAKENFLITESQASSISLNESQHNEYLELKLKVQEKLAKTENINFLESYEREKNMILDKINCFKVRTKSLDEKKERHKSQYNELLQSFERISQKISETQDDLNKCQGDGNELESEINDLEKQEREFKTEIHSLDEAIEEMKESSKKSKKDQQREEVLKRLKCCYSGVHDRLLNLCNFDELFCQIRSPDIAITKIMGKNMEFIVVDTKDTARNCIEFLKEEYAGSKYSVTEYFWPLDGVKSVSLDAARQRITNQIGARLAIDIMQCDSDEIKKLLLHIVRDTVVCETDELAEKLSSQKNLDCVSLDGTLYYKNGIISGGLLDLRKKAQKWKKKSLEDLINMKERKKTELRDLQKQLLKKQESILNLRSKPQGLRERLEKYLKPMVEEYIQRIKKAEENLQKLALERKDLEKNFDLEHLQKSLIEIDNRIKNLTTQKNSVEDEIFHDFCNHIGIDNVRQYEQGDFRKLKEFIDRREEFDNHLDNILKQIELEKSLDTRETLIKLENQLHELQTRKENMKKKIDESKAKIKEIETNSHEQTDVNLQLNLEAAEKKLKYVKLQLSYVERDLKNWNITLSSNETRIRNLQSEKHEILANCKVNNVYIPLESTETDTTNPESVSELNETGVQIDYSDCPNYIKELNNEDFNNEIIRLKGKLDSGREQLKKYQIDKKSIENLEVVKRKIKEVEKKSKNILIELKSKCKNFEEIKRQRLELFNTYFELVSEELDNIFKDLYGNKLAQARILAKNNEEPYLDGIYFNCLIPNKRIVPIENLSGGEKTMCALALLLAVYSVKPAHFLIFDEIDAASDSTSIKKISNYFNKLKSFTQIIFISHKDSLTECADELVAVNISPLSNSSHVFHIDLNNYKRETR